MAKWRILITAPYLLPVVDTYREWFEREDAEYVKADVLERLEEDELLEVLHVYDGVIAGDDRFTAKVFETARNLKVLVKWGTGIDSFDTEAAVANNVTICRTPDAFTEPVADSIIGYILCFARNLAAMDRVIKEGIWKKIPGRTINESTIGVIGVGSVGSAVIRRARAFGADLIATDIVPPHPALVKALGVTMTDLATLLRKSDFVVVGCDLNATSVKLLSAPEFASMKSTACIVNCARGPIVDEEALIEALQKGEIAGAAMDVFEHEPLPEGSPLRDMDNVLLAAHNSNSSPRAWEFVHKNSLTMLFNALADYRS